MMVKNDAFSAYSKKLDKISSKLEKISNDPAVIEEGERLHKILSFIAPEELFKPFTI